MLHEGNLIESRMCCVFKSKMLWILGLRGLVHVSELFQPGEPRNSLHIGDTLDVIMLEFREEGKFSFSR